jgi:hypothetical protein
VADEEKRTIGSLDDTHGADRERRVEASHGEPTRGPGQASKHVEEGQVAPA